MKREKMAYRLKKELDAARYAHTLGVEKTAREMAEKFGVDEEKAALAGLLHDCAKCMPLSQMTKNPRRWCMRSPGRTSRRTSKTCTTRRCSVRSAGTRPGTRT